MVRLMPFDPISKVERLGLALLVVAAIAFGVLVDIRSAFLKSRHTDFAVFLRAAWAVREGEDPYQVSDEHGWHYHYPPLTAMLLRPMAEPPLQKTVMPPRRPFATWVAIWYVASMLALWWGTNNLANALQETDADQRVRNMPRYCRYWWALRAVPIVISLVNIGSTAAASQVDLFVLAMLCGMAAAAIRGRSWRAGLWLAGAVVVKVIPAFLLVYPLWRRDLRMLLAAGLGLGLGFIVVPALLIGPTRTMEYNRTWFKKVIMPAAGDTQEQTRLRELHGMAATDNQSPIAVIHNTIHANLPIDERPAYPSLSTRIAALAIGGAIALLTLWAGRWRRMADGACEMTFIALLIIAMVMASPLCHLAYFCLALPLVMAYFRLYSGRAMDGSVQVGVWVVLGIFVALNVVPRLPGLEPTRFVGVATYGVLVLWGATIWELRRTMHRTGDRCAAAAALVSAGTD